MSVVEDQAALRDRLADSGRIAFVPTMGALHEGHASLIRLARSRADTVVVSVFVNPTQFGPDEDFDRYPRDLESDLATARAAGADVVFAPTVTEIYPDGFSTTIDPGPIARHLCGATRPGHFAGVATVVVRLFGLVHPALAIFSRKDFQQLAVIEGVTRDLALPVEVVGGPTVRDADGLALSSRNRYLDASQRRRARALPRALRNAALAFAANPVVGEGVREAALVDLDEVELEYLELRRARDLGAPIAHEPAVLLVAAHVGTTRLIDNLILDPAAPAAALEQIPEVPQ